MPSDGRLFSKKYQKFAPRNAVSDDDENEDIEFVFPRLEFPLCYDIANLLIFARVVITKDDKKSLPPKTRFVGGINNMLNSLFKTYILKINQVQIEEGHEHPFLSYISNLTTFGASAQGSWMSAGGWYLDNYNDFNSKTNTGLNFRTNRFRKELKDDADFSNEGACLLGHFDHCLSTIEKSLPPETTIELTLRRSSSNFFIHDPLKAGTDEKLIHLIKEIYCFMPVEHLSDELAISLRSRWEKESLTYHYRTLRWNTFAIPHQIEVTTNLLYPESLHPIRLYAFILEDSVLSGDIKFSPFEFKREWNFTKQASEQEFLGQSSLDLKQEIDELKNLILSMQRPAEPPSVQEEPEQNKGRGKNLRTRRKDSTWGEKLVQAFSGPGSEANDSEETGSVASVGVSTSSLNNFDEDTPLAATRTLRSASKTSVSSLKRGANFVYIRSLKLEINGQEVDQFLDTQYENNAVFDFVRLNLTNETIKSLFGTQMSYDSFMKGMYICGWDLSTSQTAGISANIMPMILTGYYALS